MSAVESAQQAARLADPIGHSLGLLGMLLGALAGAIAGAVLLVGTIATGGALAIAIAGCLAGACVAGGGLGGGQLVRGIMKAAGLSHPTTGAIVKIGSPNVVIGKRLAARALADGGEPCTG